ncbi:MAG: hypothetical protein ACK515_21580 [bacterium]|nr:hypothetical protein [Betaproteobacteria bacterium]
MESTVDSCRAALGTLNANTPGSVGSGRREINWDGVPAASSDPNPFAGNFFHANVAGRARGVEFTTPGSGFLVSAAAGGVTLFSRNVRVGGNGSLSFLGLQADAGERIARIRLTSGNAALLANSDYGPGADGVVMDDFIYAEPIAAAVVPVPASALLLGGGLLSIAGLGWKRRSNQGPGAA